MWPYRRILRISCIDRVANEKVLRRFSKHLELAQEIKIRKFPYLGHLMRGVRYQPLQVITERKIVGKRILGRRRMLWLQNLKEWFNCSSDALSRAAVDEIQIVMMIVPTLARKRHLHKASED